MIFAEFPWQVFMTPFGIPIAAIMGALIWQIVVAISEAITKVMCNRNDTELKLDLSARGFTADEIVRTVECGRELPPKATTHPGFSARGV
ncbi:hypothetical protein Pla22_26040 [Rubripirellula amarantea]|uniref:Uncharacterized protein n=1 Tax=Rubripirellula amarantea TaxID=2527999 RepID=A0A5C5WWI0_9BACT|nr:hypothetical protein [Rubripirellula amarantea]TWT54950.1 hypothetical protein Pla22_26040 [Rubripirellula amarantea]